MRFGIEVPQDASFSALVERWQRAEELGFDYLWVADQSADTRTNPSGDYRNLDGTWFDGLTVLAVMAKETNRIRIGTLVSNPILRPPALLAKEALTVDHLCGGRLELGIGMGIEALDHAAMGIAYWSPQERAARFSEYVEVVDGLLSTSSRAYVFEGRYYHTRQAAMGPPPSNSRVRRSPLAVSHQPPCGSPPREPIAGTPPDRSAWAWRRSWRSRVGRTTDSMRCVSASGEIRPSCAARFSWSGP